MKIYDSFNDALIFIMNSRNLERKINSKYKIYQGFEMYVQNEI